MRIMTTMIRKIITTMIKDCVPESGQPAGIQFAMEIMMLMMMIVVRKILTIMMSMVRNIMITMIRMIMTIMIDDYVPESGQPAGNQSAMMRMM